MARITVEAGSLCSAVQAQDLALHHASIATINYGFDRFIILSADAGSRSSGSAYGGMPRDTVTIRMFQAGEDGADEALDARTILGPNWEEVVKSGGRKTC